MTTYKSVNGSDAASYFGGQIRDLSPLAEGIGWSGALPDPKPLRWSFLLTSSIVVCAMWGVVYTFAQLERARFVDELSQQIAHGRERDAAFALQKMAQLRDPPLEVFVVAATSPSREVALQAQDSLNDLLRRWQHEVETPRGRARVARRLERMASALDSQAPRITSLDVGWLQRTIDRMVRLSDVVPPDEMLDFGRHCEAILALTGSPAFEPRRGVLPVATTTLIQSVDGLFSPPSRVALQSILDAETPFVLDEADPPPLPPANMSLPSLAPVESAPMPRPFPQPVDDGLKPVAPMPMLEQPSEEIDSSDPWAQMDSRTLLEHWLVEGGVPRRELAGELQRRGFGSLRSDVVRLALSGDARARVQLVHDLPAIRGLGTRAWLMLFAEDRDAEVRLAAVSVMATSSNTELLEQAWNVALHDRDPRVAGIAESLRSRRSIARRF